MKTNHITTKSWNTGLSTRQRDPQHRKPGLALVTPAEQQIVLTPHALVRFDGDNRGMRIVSLKGRCWVTQEGDAMDYELGPDMPFMVTLPGRVVVQALSDARLEVA